MSVKSIPVTPVRKLTVLAKVRSTRKGQVVLTPDGQSLGGEGKNGSHFYDITLRTQGGSDSVGCSCPAFIYGRARIVQETGACKHIHAVKSWIEHCPREQSEAVNRDLVVYAASALVALLNIRVQVVA